jgi:hypothetical protein
MYASISRYPMTATPMDDPAEVGWRLGAALTGSPGFVASVVVEDRTGALFAIGLFEDQASLIAATPLAERWMAEHRGMLEPGATEVATGEVVAQKGL